MNAFFLYLLQVLAISGIFYTYYHFFLRNRKIHLYNRFYLLISTTLSICIPFFKIPVYFNAEQDIPAVYKIMQEVTISTGKTAVANTAYYLLSALLYIYYAMVLIGLARIFLSVNKLRSRIRQYQVSRLNDFFFINSAEEGTPFSFFNWLFWDSKISIDSVKGKQILQHELFHIRQKHSFDILYLELLSALFWINPFFRLIKKEIKAIHEFSADQFAVNGDDTSGYVELLLQQTFQTNQTFVNSFFHNQIKRRIAMVTSSSTKGRQYLRKTMVLPLAFMAISIIGANCKTKDSLTEIDKNKVYEKVEIEAAFPNGETGWKNFLSANINANIPVDNGATGGTYPVFVQFIVDESGNISDIKPLTTLGHGMEDEVVRIMKLSPKWEPAKDHGVTVKSYRKQPVTFIVQEETPVK